MRKPVFIFAAGFILCVSFVMFVSGGCAKKRLPGEPVYYCGITETDSDGNIISVDDEDWQDSGILSDCLAYPNPIGNQEALTIKITLTSSVTNIYIDFYAAPGDARVESEFENTGGYVTDDEFELELNAGDLDVLEPGKTYRMYITAGGSETWGDIRIK